jgi:hypothetical protein
VTCYWHDSAFHISQEFRSFIVHCSAQRAQNAVAGVDVLSFASRAGNMTILSGRQSWRSRGLYRYKMPSVLGLIALKRT